MFRATVNPKRSPLVLMTDQHAANLLVFSAVSIAFSRCVVLAQCTLRARIFFKLAAHLTNLRLLLVCVRWLGRLRAVAARRCCMVVTERPISWLTCSIVSNLSGCLLKTEYPPSTFHKTNDLQKSPALLVSLRRTQSSGENRRVVSLLLLGSVATGCEQTCK